MNRRVRVFNQMNKKLWWSLGIVVIVLVIWASMNKSAVAPDLNSPSPSAGASATPNPSATSGTGIGAGLGAYTALVAKYGTNRVQFGESCNAIPAVAVFKTGTSVMFDNRSGDARTITIGGTKYYFPGYGWRIIKLGSTKLPATVSLSCGSAINVGTITVEK